MKIEQNRQDIIISNYNNFDIVKTFECGQCFRWNQNPDGSFAGIIDRSVITVYQQNDKIIFKNLNINKHYDKIKKYFDLERNYEKINHDISNLYFIGDACKYSRGIRILKQEPFETLISFIISQNNNIPRIKKIINRLCEKFGKKISNEYYSFPTIEDLSNISIDDLSELKCGFRDKYIIDAINKIKNQEIILNDIYNMDVETARKKLMEIKGVGNKVADCVLLYGFSKTDCFPTDTWIKKTMATFFKNGLPKVKKEYLGIIQQYIFYYVRNNKNIYNLISK